MRVCAVDFDGEVAQSLVGRVQEEYVQRYGGPDDTPLDPGVFAPPSGAFFVGYVEEVPVAMGGWRRRCDVHPWSCEAVAEVKRMYVVAEHRRAGLGALMLSHLETTAHEAGAEVMVLETGTAQPEAIALYVLAGYEAIEGFGHYAWSPKSRCFGKRLG